MADAAQILGAIGSALQLTGAILAVRAAVNQPADIRAVEEQRDDMETVFEVLKTSHRRGSGLGPRDYATVDEVNDVLRNVYETIEMLAKAQERNVSDVYERIDDDRDESFGLTRRLFTRRDVMFGLVLIFLGLAAQLVSYLI